MGHFKLSIKLTLGQKIIATMLVLNVLVNMGFSNSLWAQENTSGRKITTEQTEEEYLASLGDPAVRACEKIEEDLASRIKEISKACSATDMGAGCLQSLFQCSEGSTSEGCEGLSSLSTFSSRDEERYRLESEEDKLEALEKKKERTQEKQELAQEKVDELIAKQNDLDLETQALDTELQASFQNINTAVSQNLAKIQTDIMTLEEENVGLKNKLAEQEKQMITFMMAERLTCSQQAKEKAAKFYAVARGCSSGRGNCNLSLNTLVRNGTGTLADMAKAEERRMKRQCLRTDSGNDFAIKYQALQANIAIDKQTIKNQQDRLAKKRANLLNQVRLAQTEGTLAKNQAQLNKAQRLLTISTQKTQLLLQLSLQQANALALQKTVDGVQSEIDTQVTTVAEAKRKLSRSLGNSDLSSLREAQISAPDLLNEARSAKENGCDCKGAFSSISKRSGAYFCDDAPASDTPVEDEAFVEGDTIIE